MLDAQLEVIRQYAVAQLYILAILSPDVTLSVRQ